MQRKRELPFKWGVVLSLASAEKFAEATGSNFDGINGQREYKNQARNVRVTYTPDGHGAVTAKFQPGFCTSLQRSDCYSHCVILCLESLYLALPPRFGK